MTLEALIRENRLTEEAHSARNYLQGRVEKYVSELKEHNPSYHASLYGRSEVDYTDKRRMDWLLFEVQELAEDLTSVLFEEEGELKRYHREFKDKKRLPEISIVLKRLVQCEREHQLFNKKEVLFDLILLSTKQGHSIILILAKLGRNYNASQAD